MWEKDPVFPLLNNKQELKAKMLLYILLQWALELHKAPVAKKHRPNLYPVSAIS